MHVFLLPLIMLLADPTVPADLKGTVTGPDGQPVAQASVIVYSAAPRKGAATMSKFDYPDCVKSAKADGDGAFTIAGIDSSLNYELLVVANGYRPLMLKKVDPTKGALTARMTKLPADPSADQMLKGHVVDSSGAPVVGAYVEPYGCNDGTERWWGDTSKVCKDHTYTDANGDFVLITLKPDIQLDVSLEGRHVTPLRVPLLPTGEAVHELTMTAGATVIGRLLKDEKPLPGIHIRLTQRDRGMEHYVGDFDATTDAEGKFTFVNVHPDDDYFICGSMKTLGPYGALSVKSCRATGDDTTTDAGDLVVEEGYTVSGSVFCSDGKPIPKSAKAHLTRMDAQDSLDVNVGSDGKFEFKSVPAEVCEFWVQINGYHVSKENQSFEPLNSMWLMGKIDGDIDDLRVQLDPGPIERGNGDGSKWQTLQNTRMTGVLPQQ